MARIVMRWTCYPRCRKLFRTMGVIWKLVMFTHQMAVYSVCSYHQQMLGPWKPWELIENKSLTNEQHLTNMTQSSLIRDS